MPRSVPILLALALALAGAAHAQQGEVCERGPSYGSGPVSLVILASSAKVQQLAASVKDTPVVARDADTVVFADGRVITADVDAAGEHLNALGWGARRITVSATFPARRARPRSSYG
ncbi:MAG: hypothetical protein ACQGVC_17600 [Myxococcota bacterium]